jgi:hypothetical protein
MTAAVEDEDKRGPFADRGLNWGFLASALMHVVGIAVAGLWFSDARSFEEAQEAIPIEVVTQADLNQVTMGEKQAPPAPKPAIRAERMSPSMWGQLDGYLQEQYRQCWNKFGFDGQTYVPQIRVLFNADGSLGAEPVLANAPGDASERALADSAMRAVRRCDPIRIPPQYAPYHAQWRARTLRFDPQEM